MGRPAYALSRAPTAWHGTEEQMSFRAHSLAGVFVLAVVSTACSQRVERGLTTPDRAASLSKRSTYLKVHMRNGDLYVLSDWQVDEARRVVVGVGEHFDSRRALLGVTTHEVSIDGVALFETNVQKSSPLIAVMGVVTGVSAAITAACLTNPKACFGSCPTFYVDGVLHAEGFSDAVTPSMEKHDIDALFRVEPEGRALALRMTNEAYETHVVRGADVLVAPRPPGGRVFATSAGELWQATDLRAPTRCAGHDGDCVAVVRAFDDAWLASAADGHDLATRETITLAFDESPGAGTGAASAAGQQAVVISARQSFMTTFLFYQVLAYMGSKAGFYLAEIERGEPGIQSKLGGMRALLGGIDVQVRDARGAWRTVGSFHEIGPLATDTQLVVLPEGADARELRLSLTQGYWRIDAVTLVTLGQQVTPRRLRPRAVIAPGKDAADAHARLLDDARVLTTMPGDEYTLVYDLPGEPGEQELFLDSQGYYLEWMRDEWMPEESAAGLAMMLYFPEVALRVLAPKFKRIEPTIEEMFWKSRYAAP